MPEKRKTLWRGKDEEEELNEDEEEVNEEEGDKNEKEPFKWTTKSPKEDLTEKITIAIVLNKNYSRK